MQAYVLELPVAEGLQLPEGGLSGTPMAYSSQDCPNARNNDFAGQDEERLPTGFCAFQTAHRSVSFPSMSRQEVSAGLGSGQR